MKNATIFHGISGNPNQFWFPYLQEKLSADDYSVWVPQLPNADYPDLTTWLKFALKNGSFDENSVLIEHSSGCPLLLSILENLDIKVHQAILVAGFSQSLGTTADGILQDSYDWQKIKANCNHFSFINSDNDPWGCSDAMGRRMFDKLGGQIIIRHGDGHMGSDTFNQPYKTFPLVYHIIKTEEKSV